MLGPVVFGAALDAAGGARSEAAWLAAYAAIGAGCLAHRSSLESAQDAEEEGHGPHLAEELSAGRAGRRSTTTQYGSLGELFENSVARVPRAPARSTAWARPSPSASSTGCSRDFGAWLQAKGLPKGARVAIMMPNCLQYPVAMFGALRAGCIVVNVNPLYTARELEHQLKDSGAEAIVILENFAAHAAGGAAEARR